MMLISPPVTNAKAPLRLCAGANAAVFTHMTRCYPREGCGFLFGRDGIGEEFIPMENAAAEPGARFAIDPVLQIEIFKAQRERGQKLVAIVHSHIDTAAFPSEADIAGASYPEADNLIIAVYHNEAVAARAFRIAEGRVTEKPVKVHDPGQS